MDRRVVSGKKCKLKNKKQMEVLELKNIFKKNPDFNILKKYLKFYWIGIIAYWTLEKKLSTNLKTKLSKLKLNQIETKRKKLVNRVSTTVR